MRRSEGKMKCYRKIKRVKGGQGRKKSSGKERLKRTEKWKRKKEDRGTKKYR